MFNAPQCLDGLFAFHLINDKILYAYFYFELLIIVQTICIFILFIHFLFGVYLDEFGYRSRFVSYLREKWTNRQHRFHLQRRHRLHQLRQHRLRLQRKDPKKLLRQPHRLRLKKNSLSRPILVTSVTKPMPIIIINLNMISNSFIKVNQLN